MRAFKFFANPIADAHDGGKIRSGETFYSMCKYDFVSITGENVPKYSILERCEGSDYTPSYESFWYFRSKSNAEYLKTIWQNQDNR